MPCGAVVNASLKHASLVEAVRNLRIITAIDSIKDGRSFHFPF